LVEIRIYRGTFVLALLALVVVMFSLHARPPALSSTLAPDAFDDQGAYGLLTGIARHTPDRRPGSEGDRAVAAMAATRFRALGLETRLDRFRGEVDGGDVDMVNVVGTLSGESDRQVVVMAHRDAEGRPGASSAASTAVMLELATALSAAQHNKTLVFVSTDGGSASAPGARRFAERYADRSKVDAVLVIDDVAAAYAKRPYVVPWSAGSGRASLQLARTADAALFHELGTGGGSESALGQFLRQAWPLTLREQGVLLDDGMNAVTLTAHGEVPRSGPADTPASLSRLRLLRFGKAALATALALDAGPRLERSPASYVVSGHNVIPGWAISLLAIGLLAPALAAALDGFARARRRGRAVADWVRWVVAASVPFLIAIVAARVFELFDWLPSTPLEALAPATRPSFAEAAPPLTALALVFVLAWLVVRPRVARRPATVDKGAAAEAAIALTLVLCVELFVLWLANPFACLLLIPVVHLCLLTALPEGPNRRVLLTATIAAALLLPALVLVYYGARLDLGLHLDRYALLFLTADGSLGSQLLWAVIAGGLLSTVLVALARRDSGIRAQITVRGPSTYAGPGSLGGTKSALRR
jgi:hypothetical protein